jgi:streptogramin lyase
VLLKFLAPAAAVTALATTLATPAAGEERGTRAGPTQLVASVSTAELNADTFKAPWQIAWVPNGTKTGAIVFTDRTGNAVGVLDPTTGNTQRFPLSIITNPGPVAVIDSTRFAAAGTGGVAIFDRSGSGRITQLVLANTRNQALAVGSGNQLFVADAQQHDLRIIRPPYSGPADINRFPIPAQCRNPTGLIPGTTTIDVLCQQTNNIVRIDYTGNFGSSTPIPVANSGAQEARPSPNGFVFSAFGAGQVLAFSPNWRSQFRSFALAGPAVPTVGLFYDPASDRKLAAAAARLRAGKQPARAFFFNSFTPSFRGGRFSLGSFPAGTSNPFTRLAGKNLVGSTNGPGGSIWVADATPGSPALHRISFGDGARNGRTKTGYRFSQSFTQPGPDFLARMAMPFTGPAPSEVRVGITGASASAWNLKGSFSDNFGLKATVRGALPGAGSYQVKVSSADTGAYTRAYLLTGIRPNTRSLTMTLTGGDDLPASFKVDAVAETPPCKCDSLDVRLEGQYATGSREVTLGFNWTLECTGGAGPCDGSISISGDGAARAAGVKVNVVGSEKMSVDRAGSEIEVTCKGDCKGLTTSGPRDRSYLILRAPDGRQFDNERGIGSVSVVAERTCGRPLAPKVFKIAFGAGGFVSERRSDLNGNGVADGREKK